MAGSTASEASRPLAAAQGAVQVRTFPAAQRAVEGACDRLGQRSHSRCQNLILARLQEPVSSQKADALGVAWSPHI